MSKMSKFSVHADGRGVSRQYDERLSEATGVLDQYVIGGNVDAPYFEKAVETMADEMQKRNPSKELDECEWRAREVLKARATNEDTMYPCIEKEKNGKKWFASDPVVLDLDDMAGAKNRQWGLPLPAIYFAMLDPKKDSMYSDKCKAVAIYFDPHISETTGQPDPSKLTIERTITWDGKVEVVASDWDPACYQGVVRTFKSFTDMREAHAALKQAVRTIREDVPTDAEPDVFEDPEYLASLEDDGGNWDGI
jgi:hypothetical protein